MNIGLFTDTYFPQINGVGTSTYTLAKQLRALGHRVYIFTPNDPKSIKDEYQEDVIPMPSMPFIFINSFRFGIVYPPFALAKIAGLHLDIVHTQTEFSLGMFGKNLARALGVPMVHTYHTMYEDYVHYIVNGAFITRSMAHSFSRLFCNFSTQVIAPTAKVKASLLQYGVSKPIEIIPTGININKFRATNYLKEETLALKLSLGLEESHKVILFVGRLAKEKSIETILKYLPEIFEKDEKIRFLIIGDGPHRESLEAKTTALGINEKVIFAGSKPWAEIGKYYQTGDVFVSASVSETQGLTFVEAMAAGLPVVAKSDPCIEGVIENEVNGLVFETDQDLPAKILYLLENKENYSTISKNATAFSENLSEENFVQKVLETYHSTIDLYNLSPHLWHLPRRHKLALTQEIAPVPLVKHSSKIKRLTKYELTRLKRTGRKMQKMALAPALAMKKFISDKNENNGGN